MFFCISEICVKKSEKGNFSIYSEIIKKELFSGILIYVKKCVILI